MVIVGKKILITKPNDPTYSREITVFKDDAEGLVEVPGLKSLDVFDGYHIPHSDKSFDLGLAIHVVEHVEHERMFLMEAARVCKQLYIEVPLEHTRNLNRAIRMSGPYGHINFYTPLTFENLLNTSGSRSTG